MNNDNKGRSVSGLHVLSLEEKAKKIKNKEKKLKNIFALLSDDNKRLLADTINNIAWMAIELQELQELIHHTGSVETYQNGQNQNGLKVSSALQAYNQLLKSYNTSIKLLINSLPDGQKGEAKDQLAQFLMGD